MEQWERQKKENIPEEVLDEEVEADEDGVLEGPK
jgi:hypothetical protein